MRPAHWLAQAPALALETIGTASAGATQSSRATGIGVQWATFSKPAQDQHQ
jgi:hypothetical protein